MTLGEIEKLTKDYAGQREILAARVKEAEDKITEIKLQHMPGIRRALEATARRQAALKTALEEAPELFEKPRTITISGVKVGFAKGKGLIKWASPARVVKLIRKYLEEQAETLIKVTENPVKSAVGKLSAADLRKIGVTVTDSGDQVVIKAMDSELDKLVSALLAESEDIKAAEAA